MVASSVPYIKMVPSHAIHLKTRATADDAFKEFDSSNATYNIDSKCCGSEWRVHKHLKAPYKPSYGTVAVH